MYLCPVCDYTWGLADISTEKKMCSYCLRRRAEGHFGIRRADPTKIGFSPDQAEPAEINILRRADSQPIADGMGKSSESPQLADRQNTPVGDDLLIADTRRQDRINKAAAYLKEYWSTPAAIRGSVRTPFSG